MAKLYQKRKKLKFSILKIEKKANKRTENPFNYTYNAGWYIPHYVGILPTKQERENFDGYSRLFTINPHALN